MHLTELSNAYDCSELPGEDGFIRGKLATNAIHPSVSRYVTWMLIGLPIMSQDGSRRSNNRQTSKNHISSHPQASSTDGLYWD